ncbi:MAG: translocation/assembly module TamB domain-containing protein [Acidobacteria bacterium]|nr:translocation/assembly module TamB domain-containing protein [Acidobacteriota bacterium]
MRRLGKWLLRLILALAAAVLILTLDFLILIRTQWLREKIRERIIAEAEHATGGRVELKSFEFDPITLRFAVSDFVLHGKEPAGDPPLARVGAIRAGIRVISFFQPSAYLDSLEADQTRIRILTFPDGSNNIPGPKFRKDPRTVFEQFVSLSARRFVMRDSSFEYDHRRIPLDVGAENFSIRFGWEREGPGYRGTVTARPFHFHWPKFAPLVFDAAVQLTMDMQGLRFERAEIVQGKSRLEFSGSMRDYRSPKLDVGVSARLAMAEYAKALRLPVSPEGVGGFQGKFSYAEGRYLLTGALDGANLAVRQPAWSIEGVRLRGDVRLEPDLVTLDNVRAQALDGSFQGSAVIRSWNTFQVRGALDSFSLEQVHRMQQFVRPLAWSARLSGPVELSGAFSQNSVENLTLDSRLLLEPESSKIPMEGAVQFRYQQAGERLTFESSYLKTPRTRVDFAGVLGDRLRLSLDSSDLNDFLPAAAFLSETPPQAIPLQLDGGTAQFQGSITTLLKSPRIQGHLSITGCVLEKRKLDRISAEIDADSSRLVARRLHAEQAASQVEGDLQMALHDWRLENESRLLARLDFKHASIEQFFDGAHTPVPAKGVASGRLTIEGAFQRPQIDADLTVAPFQAGEEKLERVRVAIRYQDNVLEFRKGLAEHGGGRIAFAGRYQHSPERFDQGKLLFDLSSDNVQLAAFQAIRGLHEGLDGRLRMKAAGAARVEKGQPAIESLNGSASVRQISVDKRALGGVQLSARTSGDQLVLEASGDLLETPLRGSGQFLLNGEGAGQARFTVNTLTLARLREFFSPAGRPVPVNGSFQSEIQVAGALRKPDAFRAMATLTNVIITPLNENSQLSAAVVDELTLRGKGPILFDLDAKGIHIREAQLAGKETSLQIAGQVHPRQKNAWDVLLKGSLNLGILQDSVAGIRTSGLALVNATVRGALDKPQLGGLMEIKDLSASHRDVPASIDKASGVVVFDRNRALLQNITAQAGGGELKLSGFLTIGEENEVVSYRLNGQAEKVRVRYPEGASTTINANLSLTGTETQSLLAGAVTIVRSGFTRKTDLGSLLLEPARPIATTTTNPLLRGMQFDLHVTSGPNLQLETSITQGLQMEVDMRLRGSPSKPVVLGTVAVTQGELNVFGTRYAITRGTVSFFNAARIEPVLALDLETIVRAVTVNMSVSGPLDKMNITYRSDPPLQTSDIIALLALGRTPTTSAVTTPVQADTGSSAFYGAGSALLSQALSAGLSNTLPRFFGVSRVKIDPQRVGLETTPQARLTVEQQVSREVTVTYVTNLTGTLQQLVRLDWDFHKNWSATAVRDDNGVLGADIFYRKRFK